MRNRGPLLLLLIMFITLPLVGCSSAPPVMTTEGYIQLCLSLVGHDINGLIERWGYPHRILKIPGGRKVYVYREIIDPYGIDIIDYTALLDYPPFIRHPVITGDVIGGYYLGENCVTYLEVNEDDKIVKVIWKGDCKARKIPSLDSHGHF